MTRSPASLEEVPAEKVCKSLKCPLTGFNAGQGPGNPVSKPFEN